MRKLFLVLIMSFLLMIVPLGRGDIPATITVNSKVSVATSGNADDPAIWIHPTNPEKSVVIGTDKDDGLFVWDMEGNELQHDPHTGSTTNNVDVRYNVSKGTQFIDVVAANLRSAGKLAVHEVNSSYGGSVSFMTQLAGVDNTTNIIQANSYGFTLYKRLSDNTLFVFDKTKYGGKIQQYRVDIDGSGNVTVTNVRNLSFSGGAEGMVADDELGYLYVAEEGLGVHKYYADPDSGNDSIIVTFATGDGITGDREGVALYECNDGTGYLLLSNQGGSNVKVYKREGEEGDPHNHTLITTIDTVGSVATDGLDVTRKPTTAKFPKGFLVTHDDPASFHYYSWEDIAGDYMTICANTTSPTISNVSVSLNATTLGNVINITAAVTRGISDVNNSEVFLYVKTTTDVIIWNATMSNHSSSIFNASWNTTGNLNGTYLIQINASDIIGNTRSKIVAVIGLSNSSEGTFINNTISTVANTTVSVNATTTSNTIINLEIVTTSNVTGSSIVIVEYNSTPPNTTTNVSSGVSLNKFFDIILGSDLNSSLSWIMINISYDESEVTAASLGESSLRLYRYNKSSASWTQVANSSVATSQNYVWGNLTSFSSYGTYGNTGSDLWTCSETGFVLVADSRTEYADFNATLQFIKNFTSDLDFFVLPGDEDDVQTNKESYTDVELPGLPTYWVRGNHEDAGDVTYIQGLYPSLPNTVSKYDNKTYSFNYTNIHFPNWKIRAKIIKYMLLATNQHIPKTVTLEIH